MRATTTVITDPRDIPRGYTRIAEIARRMPNGKRYSYFLSNLHRAGKLSAVKLVRRISEKGVGPVYVDEAAAMAAIAAWNGNTSVTSEPGTEIAVVEHGDSGALVAAANALQTEVRELRNEVADLRAAIELLVEAAANARTQPVKTRPSVPALAYTADGEA